ncbi:heme o synthase [Candidatus Saccharibacteria bacterium]|nr:heme o synthase [Candidatus Saccharibacteria bacterium]
MIKVSSKKIQAYWQFTKPGVTFGNLLTVAAGYLLVSAGSIDLLVFFGVMLGMYLVIAGACALNNYLDRDIDVKMSRTKKRPSVISALTPGEMLTFAIIIALAGFIVLVFTTNTLTLYLALMGYFCYVWLYGAWSKRSSVHGTAVGAVSGAFPIISGYAAGGVGIDFAMIICFLILYFWQFPEFYSIAIYRRSEYRAANIPLISIVRGVKPTIKQIFVYTVLYVASTLALGVTGLVGVTYMATMTIAGIWWLMVAFEGLSTQNTTAWSKRMFRGAMYHILLLCIMLAVGPLLP